jgi:hypothetical protein
MLYKNCASKWTSPQSQAFIGAGVIDPDYTGEIKVILFNHSQTPFPISIGDKIAQIVLEQAKTPRIQVLKYLKPTLRGTQGFGSSNLSKTQKIQENPKKANQELIILPKLMERPKGCCFIGSKPSIVKAALGHIQGPETEVIIDSGSDITLVSRKAITTMTPPPKEHTGKKVTLSQVTAKTSIQSFVDLPLFFETNNGPVQVNVEAYVVKGMTTPLIMGNDFADQYSLSIERKGGKSNLRFADTGRTIKLNNGTSDLHLPNEVKAFLATIKRKQHSIRNQARRKAASQTPIFTDKRRSVHCTLFRRKHCPKHPLD